MSDFTVNITPAGPSFPCPASSTLLAAAAQADISLLSSCRNGTCRTCIRKLASGQVRYEIEWPGLSAEEKRGGYILPCVAYPVSDLVLDDHEAANGYVPWP